MSETDVQNGDCASSGSSECEDGNPDPEFGGPKNEASRHVDMDDIFNLFFDDSILNLIIDCTNRSLTVQWPSGKVVPPPITINEMRAFVGLLVYTGTLDRPHTKASHYFCNYEPEYDIFYTTMTHARFEFILNSLKFDDFESETAVPSHDVLAPMRNFITSIMLKCSEYFEPGKNVTIGEQFLPCLENADGRIANNSRRGIKVMAMIDSSHLYCVNFDACLEEKFLDLNAPSRADEDAVLRVVAPISGSGRNVTLHRRYMSLDIGNCLLSSGLSVVGALKKERIGGFSKDSLTVTESGCKFIFGDGSTLMIDGPERPDPMILYSTARRHRRSGVIDNNNFDLKSDMLDLYGETVGAVDAYDAQYSKYGVGVHSQNWRLVLFFYTVNVCTANANIIYNANNRTQMDRKMFLEELARFLVEAYVKERSSEARAKGLTTKSILKVYKELEVKKRRRRKRKNCY